MSAELNARIGRTLPAPMFGVLVCAHESPGNVAQHAVQQIRNARVGWLSVALVVALWPHWSYMARRMADGSDEPWGILALVTVLVLLVRDRTELRLPKPAALVTSAALAVAAATATLMLPNLAAAAIAMIALGCFVVHALPRRPATPLLALLLLALPVIASLQFYLGYPLRALTAEASVRVLGPLGYDATAAGASIDYQGATVLVDAPCAGIGMLWVGSYTAALLSFLSFASARRTVLNGVVAALLVLIANVARNTALFFPEAGLVHWPSGSHQAIGLAAFALAIAPIVIITTRTIR